MATPNIVPGFGNILAGAAARNIGRLAPVLASTAGPAAEARGGGINPLLIQLLAAAGTDISTGAGGRNVLAVLQQNIGAQNYAKVLSSILGGEIPGAKMAVSADGIKLNLPSVPGATDTVGAVGDETTRLPRYDKGAPELGVGDLRRGLLSPFGLAG